MSDGVSPGSRVSKNCPESVPGVSGTPFDTPGTLSGHFLDTPEPRDTPSDTPSDTPHFRGHFRGHSGDTLGPKAGGIARGPHPLPGGVQKGIGKTQPKSNLKTCTPVKGSPVKVRGAPSTAMNFMTSSGSSMKGALPKKERVPTVLGVTQF